MKKLKELDVQDKEGNIVISPDLKVRHKDSQYEYTVDSVIKDDDKEIVVLLRLPEMPRVDPEDNTPSIISDLASEKVLYEIDPNVSIYVPDDEEESEDDLLAVSQKEFEKEYEVK
jgi:hypothetical protein|tara:strand:+ start:157 stop:501 length:345 start_codon:yes stop_codon:yes gene_type:complete